MNEKRDAAFAASLSASVALAVGGCSPDARLVDAADEPGSWLSHGRTYDEQRHSTLDRIDTETVASLGLAWFADLDTDRGQEATPLMVDGVLFVATAWSKVKAFDAASGGTLWEYDPEVDPASAAYTCCDVVNRGVAYWDDKVFVGTIDGRLVGLDADTGRVLWDVDTIDRAQPYTITGAPRVVKGKVIIGNAGAEFGVRGYVSAYDAETGALEWRFYTVPGDPRDGFEHAGLEMAAATWSGEWWRLGGGGTVWDSMAYDPGLDLLYIGVGNGSPWNHTIRSRGVGDNLFLASIVALDPDDGSYVWHYQTTPGESWDHTATQHIIVADLMLDGTPRRVVMQAPKNGFFYVLDAASGELISAEPYTDISWATHVDIETGRPVEAPEARYDATGQPFRSLQSPQGAHTWHPMAYSPDTRLVYIPIHDTDYTYFPPSSFEAVRMGVNLGLGQDPEAPSTPAAQLRRIEQMEAGTVGRLIAWDPVAQREVWRSNRTGPANGGVLSTAGGLVFQGTGEGEFQALDAESGERLWWAETQTGVMAAPITYEVDGTQYVAIVVGTGGSWGVNALVAASGGSKGNRLPNRSRVLVYSLGGSAQLPPPRPTTPPQLRPPEATATQETVAAGARYYAMHCAICHGPNAVNVGILPDLRFSTLLASRPLWRDVVLDGESAANGMPGYSPVLDEQQSEAIRAYVIDRARMSFELE